MIRSILTLASVSLLAACGAAQDSPASDFGSYWYQGKAEVARYALTQSRYGEPREGHAVLVFVTENFDREAQVKDEGRTDPADSVGVLKLNRIQRFTTGMYDYSLMQSVFTPTDRSRDPHTLKTTASVQDWCGHVWAQLNLRGDAYALTGHSYFQSEGEESRELPRALLEDELFNLVRLGPSALPLGDVRLIPGVFDARLRHRSLRVEDARAELREADAGTAVYAVRYASGREFEITFQRAFPHGIVAFAERVGGQETRAERTHVEQTAYWSRNGRRDASSRSALGLKPGDIGRADG